MYQILHNRESIWLVSDNSCIKCTKQTRGSLLQRAFTWCFWCLRLDLDRGLLYRYRWHTGVHPTSCWLMESSLATATKVPRSAWQKSHIRSQAEIKSQTDLVTKKFHSADPLVWRPTAGRRTLLCSALSLGVAHPTSVAALVQLRPHRQHCSV